jgi:hypothetical protein
MRSPLRPRKRVLTRQVTSKKRFNSYEIFYERTRKKLPLNTGNCLTGIFYVKLVNEYCNIDNEIGIYTNGSYLYNTEEELKF